MEKEYAEKVRKLSEAQAQALRDYMDGLMRAVSASTADLCTGEPAAAPPGAADHNRG